MRTASLPAPASADGQRSRGNPKRATPATHSAATATRWPPITGLTQEQVAHAAGITTGTLSKIETAAASPSDVSTVELGAAVGAKS
jgi:hypothetical protein